MRFWGKGVVQKLSAYSLVASIILSLICVLVLSISEGFSLTIFKMCLLFVGVTIFSLLVYASVFFSTQSNKVFGLISLLFVFIPLVVFYSAFFWDNYWIYDNWRFILIAFTSGLFGCILVSVGFMGKQKMKSKFIHQMYCFVLILGMIMLNFVILESITIESLRIASLIVGLVVVVVIPSHQILNRIYK